MKNILKIFIFIFSVFTIVNGIIVTISTCSEFVIPNGSTAEFQLTSDIDCISNSFNPPTDFAGTFNGNGFRILRLSLTMSAATGPYGIFLSTTSSSIIKNVVVENALITCKLDDCGILIGLSKGLLQNCTVLSSTINNNSPTSINFGGMVGRSENSNIVDCNSLFNTVGGLYVTNVGGLVGKLNGGSILNGISSFNLINTQLTGSGASSSTIIGGLVGLLSTNAIVDYSISHSNQLSGRIALMGGNVGKIEAGSVLRNPISYNNSFVGTISGLTITAFYGGNVGYNLGQVLNSSSCDNYFRGLTLYGNYGGNVGWNGVSGSISNIVSSNNNFDIGASVGGIVNKNEGIVSGCSQSGSLHPHITYYFDYVAYNIGSGSTLNCPSSLPIVSYCYPSIPSTLPPSTLPPSTLPPSTLPPSTLPPSTLPPSTLRPTTRPSTLRPTQRPSTLRPTTQRPSTLRPTTLRPTTLP